MSDRTVRENLRALPFEDVKRAMQYMKQHVPAAVYMRACGIANANAFNAIHEYTLTNADPLPMPIAATGRIDDPNRGVPRKTVEDRVRFYFEFDRVKHDLDYDTDDKINAMPQCELLRAISEAIEEIFPDEPDPEEEPLHPTSYAYRNGNRIPLDDFADDDIPF